MNPLSRRSILRSFVASALTLAVPVRPREFAALTFPKEPPLPVVPVIRTEPEICFECEIPILFMQPLQWLDAIDCINKTKFGNFDPETLMIEGIRTERGYQSDGTIAFLAHFYFRGLLRSFNTAMTREGQWLRIRDAAGNAPYSLREFRDIVPGGETALAMKINERTGCRMIRHVG